MKKTTILILLVIITGCAEHEIKPVDEPICQTCGANNEGDGN